MWCEGAVSAADGVLIGIAGGCLVAREPGPEPVASPRLLDQVRQAIRARHYSPRTEKAYVGWIRRFVRFHGKRHPREMGEAQITEFVSALATNQRVSASTQNQALSALLFLYTEALGRPARRQGPEGPGDDPSGCARRATRCAFAPGA